MDWQARVFHSVAWLTARHVMHFQAIQVAIARTGQWFMRMADAERFEHATAALEQQWELNELQALRAAYQMKRAASLGNGWKDRHAEQLDAIAHVLVTNHDWDTDDVGTFVEDLTEGYFVFASSEDDDD